MPITSLRLSDFRNFISADIAPCEGLNILSGLNGSGKTSLLESVYFLSYGKSFRSSQANRLIRQSSDQFSIIVQFDTNSNRKLAIGMERSQTGVMRMRLDEKDVLAISELTNYLPIRLINSQSHQLFESGPLFRRKFLDWGLFYQSDQFLSIWRHYERALKQRNAILKYKRPKNELEIWTIELIKYGLALNNLRFEYVQALKPLIEQVSAELIEVSDLDINYYSGWDETDTFEAALEHDFVEEYRLGYTQSGPHRADLDLKINGVPVQHFLSRGQQKLLICAMILAQGMLLERLTNKGLIYLVDDLPSELDLHSRTKLISLLSKQQTQIFVTAIESATISDLINDQSNVTAKVFHVEHGKVTKVTLGVE